MSDQLFPSGSLVVAVSALILSALSIYLTRFWVRGPRIFVMNGGDLHKPAVDELDIVALPYAQLPHPIREEFPDIKREEPYYATASVVFANAGERAAFVTIHEQTVKSPDGSPCAILPLNYKFLVVSAGSIARHRFLLHNIAEPPRGEPISVDLHVAYTWQGAGQRQRQGRCRVRVAITHPLDA